MVEEPHSIENTELASWGESDASTIPYVDEQLEELELLDFPSPNMLGVPGDLLDENKSFRDIPARRGVGDSE